MLVLRSLGAVFYHIPKTGGISVRSLLDQYKTIGPEDYRFRLKPGIDPLHINQKDAAQLYDIADLKEFVIVRDPLRRLVSMYGYGKNSTRFGSFGRFIQEVSRHYKNSYLSNFYDSQVNWITERTQVLKFEEVIKDPQRQLLFLGIDVTDFPAENSAEGKYMPTIEEQDYCLEFLDGEYTALNYTKERLNVG